jgi:hypothetical protein
MWIWLYLILFVGVSAYGTYDSFENGRSLAIVVAEGLTDCIAAIGLLLYAIRPEIPALYEQWNWIAIVILAAFIDLAANDVRWMRANFVPDDGAKYRNAEVLTIVGYSLFLVPAIWLNFCLGFPELCA